MKEFIKLISSGVLSGLIVLGFTWYVSDLRDNLKISLRVDGLEKIQEKTTKRLDELDRKINDLYIQFARIDERTQLKAYNKQEFNQVIQKKNIPQPKAESAKDFLNSMPSIGAAMNYLEKDLGFSSEEAKTVVIPQSGSMKKNNDVKK